MNFNELDQFRLSDTVKYHNRLNRRLWGSNEHLLPDVRDKLLAIAEDFREFLGVDNLRVQDITLSGSNAAYNYTDRSDIDLHLIVDMPDDPVYQELFNAKKYQYNDEHNLTISGADVELYVQPAGQPHVSQGIYSVKNGDWIQVPRRKRAQVDDSCVRDKAADLDARIHAAVKSGNADMMSTLWNKIKTMRQAGLEQHGEFGCENITFKLLRDQGCIQLLKDAHLAAQDHAMSLVEKNREKGRVTYGFGNRVTEDVTITPDGVSASTRMFLSEKGDQDDIIVHEFIQHVVTELGIDPTPEIKLHTDPEWSEGNHSFGRYDPESHTLNVSLPNRHILDVLRTVAHELVHCDQHQTNGHLPADAGETGSEYENDANARAGIIMRDFAAAHPEYFAMEPLGEGASGYIPKNKKEAAMPQYAMALSVDVKPGQTGQEANKMALQTGPNGEPKLLMKNLRNALREFKETGTVLSEQDLFEINMGGKNLRREAAKTGALAGMEFEMIVPDTADGDEDQEPDFDTDERAYSPQDIRDFFYDSDYNSRRDVERLLDRMMDDYGSWQVENFDTRWDSDSDTFIYDYVRENVDEDSIRELLGLEPDDDLTQKEYLLAADKIATEQLEPFYSDAQDLSRDEYYENDNFEDWLAEEDIRTMSEIYHRYSMSINWPHYTSSLAGGTSVEDIADDFSKAVGRPTRASSGYHASSVERPAPGKNFYIVEPDGSLEPDGPGDSGLEFVSPPLPIDEIMSDLNKVKAWADRMGCYTNDSTGLHINISVPDYSIDNLDYVKLALLMGDEYVLQQFGRASNTYAKSAVGKIRGKKIDPAQAKNILDQISTGMNSLASKAIHSGITEKYTSINTKDGHVEFRSPGGDWLDENFDKIENTLMRFTVALSAALNPLAYREEYLKKLYKILNVANEKDPLAIFARYAAGQLPAAALKSFVRQAQAERRTKKEIENLLDAPLWKVIGSRNLPREAQGITVKARNELEAFDQAAKAWNLDPDVREKDYYELEGWTAVRQGLVNGHRWRVSLKPELGGGVVEVIAADPVDAKKQAIQQTPDWRFVDAAALTVTRLDEPAAGASTTQSHPEGRGRPNDPTGQYAIVRRDDARAYPGATSGSAPDYVFRFSLGPDQSPAQMARPVLLAWAARNAVDAQDYMVVDTTQFAAPEPTAAPAGSDIVTYEIYDREDSSPLETFTAADDAAAMQFLDQYRSMGPHTLTSHQARAAFGVRRAPIPGSTLDLQRQRYNAVAAAASQNSNVTDYTSRAPTPIPGVEDIEIEIPPALPPAQSAPQWEVYRRSDGVSMFPLDAATQAQAWTQGRQWVQQTSNDTGITLNPADYSVRQAQ